MAALMRRSLTLRRQVYAVTSHCQGYHSVEPSPMSVGVIGSAFRGGQRRVGVEEGPKAIRHGGFLEAAIRALGHDVVDYGDLRIEDVEDIPPRVKSRVNNIHLVGGFMKELSKRVTRSLKENRLTIVLGGDHSMAIGTMHAHATSVVEDLSVIYVDAHADINTPTTSHTGNCHGMPIALLCGETRRYIDFELDGLGPLSWLEPVISCKDLAYIGLRDVEPWERVAMNYLGILDYNMQSVDDIGVKEVIRQALMRINPNLRGAIHLSVDVDALCPEYTPSTGLPVAGGLSLREVIQVAEVTAATGRLRLIEIAELNPKVGTSDDVHKTVEAAHAIILAACGLYRGGVLIPGASGLPIPQPMK